MKILVTGASGFIGSFLCEKGIEEGHQVWAGVRRTSSRRYLQSPELKFAELDFKNPDILRKQLQTHREEHGGWDVVIHCAGVTKCLTPEEFELNNYLYTRHLAEALIELKITPRQFVYVSSLSVFGPIREEAVHSVSKEAPYIYAPITEKDTPQPNTAYGLSKLRSEEYLQELGKHLPSVIFRPTGVYGPREKDYFLMAKSIQSHVDFSVGYKRQELTFIYVKDLAQAIYLAITHGTVNRSYFVSDGGVYESRAFSDLIQKELGNPWVLHIKSPLCVLKLISSLAEWGAGLFKKSSTLNRDKYRIMKQRNWQCDISPLINELGFRPEYDLEKGVRETIAWYKQEGWL